MAEPRTGAGSVIKSVEFYNIELAPLADGRVYVAMLATTVDDQEPQCREPALAGTRPCTNLKSGKLQIEAGKNI